jgi:indoleamine 2,3-dioxygenase
MMAPNSVHLTPEQWKRFGVSQNGFLPAKAPLQRLSDPYFAPWEDLIQQLSKFLEDDTFRHHIHQLPVLSVQRLSSVDELRRGYVILAFFAHSYIWGGDKACEVCDC